ncbi:hypothetical protein EVJ58_g7917 [Rhodofomes roseus]|uniref:TAP-like protein n=1 Tax=Rhodofomes roseus TaxID=34475 RepID=A0A4Y9Y586_9APHY|nr:hypothetical protein EVJ58_g7917 [Rhodofomes roseus]
MDYQSDSPDAATATIALQMLPAKDSLDVQGTILINPGGPGQSGTVGINRWGRHIAEIVGGNYNILGFDPRGTGASTPSAQCFESDFHHQLFGMGARRRLLSLDDDSVAEARGWEQLAGQQCMEVLDRKSTDAPGETSALRPGRFMSSASVATDMLTIIDKLGQDKLNYWGFVSADFSLGWKVLTYRSQSYGTVLGQYFATMYPKRVGRLVLDGVCDAQKYLEARWNGNLLDTDAVEASFYQFCFEGGPGKCPLYEVSPTLIRDRVYAIRDTLRRSPIPVQHANGPALLTEAALDMLTFGALYVPIRYFATLAEILVAAEKRDQKTLANFAAFFSPMLSCDCDPTILGQLPSNEAFSAIACSDGDPVSYDPESHARYFRNMSSDSPRFAPVWGNYYLRCTEWKIRPKWRYTGPFGSPNTSSPLLFVSPKYDTVCPVAQARAAHARFPGSALLVQDSYGHTVPSAPSVCTARHIRAYFQNGTLPEEGTECGADEVPFVGETVPGDLSVDDRQLLDTLEAFARVIP